MFSVEGSLSAAGDWKSGGHVIQTRNVHVPPGSAYTIGFSHVYNTTHLASHSWKEGRSQGNVNGRSAMQTFSRTGTLPSYSAHQVRRTRTAVEEQTQTELLSDASEVATTF